MVAFPGRCTKTFEFTNSHGEPLTLVVDLRLQSAVLSSSDFDTVTIEDGRIRKAELILAEDEFRWLAGVWRDLFGCQLRKLPFTRIIEAMQEFQQAFGDGR